MDKDLIKLAKVPLVFNKNIDDLVEELINNNKVFIDNKEVLKQVFISLLSGHHVILYGPVGTGKTELVREISKIFEVDLDIVTVGDDWDAPEYLIGWEEFKQDHFEFIKGPLLITLEKCFKYIKEELIETLNLKNKLQACWLVLDEMNRGDINKYTSSFITALEPLKNNLTDKDFEEKYKINIKTPQGFFKIPIPLRFRIIGTINTFDKNLLYKFPAALKGRRFLFIPINPPKNIEREKLIVKSILYKEFQDKFDELIVTDLIEYASSIIQKLRMLDFEIGTAIFIDVIRYSYIEYIHSSNNIKPLIDSAISVKIIPMLQDLNYLLQENIISFFKERQDDFSITLNALKSLIENNNIYSF